MGLSAVYFFAKIILFFYFDAEMSALVFVCFEGSSNCYFKSGAVFITRGFRVLS